MEDEGDRHVAVLEDKGRMLSKLALLLDWHIGRPLTKIGSLEIDSLRNRQEITLPGFGAVPSTVAVDARGGRDRGEVQGTSRGA
jgi:hypothetical protein